MALLSDLCNQLSLFVCYGGLLGIKWLVCSHVCHLWSLLVVLASSVGRRPYHCLLRYLCSSEFMTEWSNHLWLQVLLLIHLELGILIVLHDL